MLKSASSLEPSASGAAARLEQGAQGALEIMNLDDAPDAAAMAREQALRALAGSMASFIDGRARVRHDALRNNDDLDRLGPVLESSGQFESIKINATTGSVLMIYNADQMDRAQFLVAALPLGFFLAGKNF